MALSYFNTPISKSHNDDTIYHTYLYHVIIQRGTTYHISYLNYTYMNPKNLVIDGKIMGVYAIDYTNGYVCTDKNTYFVCYYGPSIACNCICSDVRIGTHHLILYTNDNRLIYYRTDNANMQSSTPVPVTSIAMVCNFKVQSFGESMNLFLSSTYNRNLKLKQNIKPLNMWRFVHLPCVFTTDDDSNGIRYNILDLEGNIYRLPLVRPAKVIVDYSTNTRESSQDIYFIDQSKLVRTIIGTDTSYIYSPMFQLDSNVELDQIQQIVQFGQYCIVIGTTFIHAYGINCSWRKGVVIKWDDSFKSIGLIKFVTTLFENRLIFKYDRDFIVIESRRLSSNNPAITVTKYDNFVLPGYTSTIVRAIRTSESILPVWAKPDLFFSCGKFFTNGYKTIMDMNGQQLFGFNDAEKYRRIQLFSTHINVECDLNAFDQVFNTAISLNFKNQLSMDLSNQSNQSNQFISMSTGPGTRRDIDNRIMDYIQNNLLTPSTRDHFGYKLNLSNEFWRDMPNNRDFYFGKFIAYMLNREGSSMPFHFSMSYLYTIYMKMQREKYNAVQYDIDCLAPFHQEFMPQDFQSMKTLGDNYKISNDEFAKLELPFESFSECILDRLKINISDVELQCLLNIADGMYNFNPSLANLSMIDLCKTLSGDFKYDRVSVLKNINVCADTLNVQAETLKMQAFLHGLTNEELMQFMINVTGYHIRDSGVYVRVTDHMRDVHIIISTCRDRLTIFSEVFHHENYCEVLKAYFCSKDTHMVS
jgi:hypothetical protein